MPFQGVKADPPTRRHLRHWAAVCACIDAQPYRQVRFPFPADPLITARLLKRMARFDLVRHREQDCAWRLSATWRDRLTRLIAQAPEDAPVKPPSYAGEPVRCVAAGPDTMNINLLAEEVPAKLLDTCAEYKARAQADDQLVTTHWTYGDLPLLMFKAGKGTSGKDRVSWSYILRNTMIELKLRKAPLGAMVGAVRLSAEALWTLGAKGALDAMRLMLRRMWADPELFRDLTFQLSQVHLCADFAHFPLDARLLGGILSHALKRDLHTPHPDDPDGNTDDDGFDAEEPFAWLDNLDDAVYWPPDLLEAYGLDDVEDEDPDADEEEDDADPPEEEQNWAPEGGTAHFFGAALEGITFSPRGDLTVVWYDKARELRHRRKPWMRVIHEASGWQPGMLLTRIEARFKRPLLRTLQATLGGDRQARWFDDPWEAIAHYGDLWGYYAGLPAVHDLAPDVTHRGYMRLTIPQEDTNQSRWPLHPLWPVVQQVAFRPDPPLPLQVIKEVAPDIEQIDAELFGLLVTRAMLRQAYTAPQLQVLDELAHYADGVDAWAEARGKNFAELVRERARMAGKPLPIQPFNIPAPGNSRL